MSLTAAALVLFPLPGGAEESRVEAAARVPLFPGLGSHRRKVKTTSAQAQRYFDQGLAFLFAFNHDEAIRAFEEAVRLDPKCAMAWWGISLANGPHINFPFLPPERATAAWGALEKAHAAAAAGTPVERALIGALAKRYANPPPEDRAALDQAYAGAMRAVWKAHPRDADVGALYAEALMDLRPWDQWTPEGKAQPGTDEVLAACKAVLARDARHPLANHLYIHAVEASPHPGRADGAADRLRNLQPGLGHLVHMPSHIDVRRGRWHEAIVANTRARAADKTYREMSGKEQGFYRVYMAHNHHMETYAATMTGQSAHALQIIRSMVAEMPAEWVKENAPFVDVYVGMPFEVLVRFGRWDEILAEPEPAEHLPASRALRLAARGMALAAKGDVASARTEQTAFLEAAAKVPSEFMAGNNPAKNILDLAAHLLAGEILTRDGQLEAGLEELRVAVKAEDALRYDEPPGWIIPVRHALGANLLKAGRVEEATAVYRADLERLPENGWSLYGLARCFKLAKQPAQSAAVEARFRRVWRKADLPLTSSCFCQPGS